MFKLRKFPFRVPLDETVPSKEFIELQRNNEKITVSHKPRKGKYKNCEISASFQEEERFPKKLLNKIKNLPGKEINNIGRQKIPSKGIRQFLKSLQ